MSKQFMSGWWNYYGLTESFNRLRPLPHWIRRRLRALVWKHWKNRKTRVRELLKRGISRNLALTTGCARKGPWRMSKVKWVNIALPDKHFISLGLSFPWSCTCPICRTASYGPVCCVVWEGGAVRLLPIPIGGNLSKICIPNSMIIKKLCIFGILFDCFQISKG